MPPNAKDYIKKKRKIITKERTIEQNPQKKKQKAEKKKKHITNNTQKQTMEIYSWINHIYFERNQRSTQ